MAKLGKGEYDEALMSDEDFAEVQRQKAAWAAANEIGDSAGKQAAQDAAAALRTKYGYSGGQDGSGYEPLKQAATEAVQKKDYGEFSYQSAPNKYQAQIDALSKSLLSRPAFSYDAEKDPLYQQYKESYTRSGERAMQDTLGQVSARTGGLASSYAGTASQQTYNNYMDALNDKIPELQQLAYSMYMDEGDTQRANLDMLLGINRDALSQYNQDRSLAFDVFDRQRNFDYGADLDTWNQNYQIGRDAIDDKRYEDKTQYEQEQTALDRAYQQNRDAYSDAMDRWQLTGVLDEAGAKTLGIPAGTRTSDYQYKLAQLAKSSSSGSGGGGSGADADYEGLYAAAQQSPNPKNYIASNYKKYGFTSSTGLASGYDEWVKGDSPSMDYEGLYAAAWASSNPDVFIANNYKAYGFSTSSGLSDGYKKWAKPVLENGKLVTSPYVSDLSRVSDYVSAGLKRGQTIEGMYEGLKKQGYSDAAIDQIFSSLGL